MASVVGSNANVWKKVLGVFGWAVWEMVMVCTAGQALAQFIHYVPQVIDGVNAPNDTDLGFVAPQQKAGE
ncbi:MAG: hypothetical protein ACE5JX_08235 [Acidobacteriota bacterium]